jgi:hypothetical protein
MPDLGIGETAAALGLGDFLGLGGLFGGGAEAAAGAGLGAEAAGAGLETGLATIGAGAGGAAGGAGGLADIVGSGAGLFGGTAGLEGTALAGGVGGGIPELLGAGGATALGSAESFMGAPAASGFASPTAGFGTMGVGGTPASSALSPNVANANAGASVFDTGTSPIAGVSSTGAPAGTGASSVAAPSGVSTAVDPTAAAAGTPGASTAGSAAGTAAKSTSIGDLLSKAGTGALDSVTKNPLGIALGAGGLGYNILQGQKQSANQKALSADAATATANSTALTQQGEALTQYLQSGTLPDAYMKQVDQAIADAKTSAISNAAANGQPTDPTKNTSLAATLAGIDNQKSGMISQVAQTLFSSGASLINAGQGAAGLSGGLYQALVQNDTTQAANTGKAIATLAAALSGKSQANLGGTTIQLSQG